MSTAASRRRDIERGQWVGYGRGALGLLPLPLKGVSIVPRKKRRQGIARCYLIKQPSNQSSKQSSNHCVADYTYRCAIVVVVVVVAAAVDILVVVIVVVIIITIATPPPATRPLFPGMKAMDARSPYTPHSSLTSMPIRSLSSSAVTAASPVPSCLMGERGGARPPRSNGKRPPHTHKQHRILLLVTASRPITDSTAAPGLYQ